MDRKFILKLLLLIILTKNCCTDNGIGDIHQEKTRRVIADSVTEDGSHRPPSARDTSLESNPVDGKKESNTEKGMSSTSATLFPHIWSHTLKNTTSNQTSTVKHISRYLRGSPFSRLANDSLSNVVTSLPNESTGKKMNSGECYILDTYGEHAASRMQYCKFASSVATCQ